MMAAFIAGIVFVYGCDGGGGGSGAGEEADGIAPPGPIERVSVDDLGAEGNEGSSDVAVSADGRYVAFRSDSTNLVAGDTNVLGDVFLRDTMAGTTTRVSVDSAGAEADNQSSSPSVSTDRDVGAAFVAFGSEVVHRNALLIGCRHAGGEGFCIST